MFISELMKMTNLAISATPRLVLTHKDGGTYIAASQQDFPVLKPLADLLAQIQQAEQIPLPELRASIPNVSGNHNLILAIQSFIAWGYLQLHIIDDDRRALLTIENAQYGAQPIDFSAPIDLGQQRPFMSRFALLKREDTRVILMRPMRDKRFIINDPDLSAILFALFAGDPITPLIKPQQAGAMDLILRLFAHEELIALTKSEALTKETGQTQGEALTQGQGPAQKQELPSRLNETTAVDAQWDSADLLFHSSSRIGYHFGEFGGAFPFVNLIEPRPAVRPLPAGERIDLYAPSMAELIKNDPSLSQLQMSRLSIRAYNEEKPISAKDMGEFLYRTARVLYLNDMEVTNAMDETQKTIMDLAWRPYPTGGASYELEVYLTVDRARDLDPGMYYYAPKEHQLIKISAPNQHTQSLLDTAHISCARMVRPQVLIHIAARFQRVSWKYHAIAYATNLRNTGVLYQTFYLNAIAMGLAPCGLGSGSTDVFAKASGNDPLVEGNIGEFMLGSMPEGFDVTQSAQYKLSCEPEVRDVGSHANK